MSSTAIFPQVGPAEPRRREETPPYGSLVLGGVPRLLSMADRNPCSPTYGCFDRGFWHYRTLIDYAAPIHQEAALTLVIAAQQQGPGNPHAGAQPLYELAGAALRFWASLQRGDGSFDEFYPHERSFVATAFTAYAVSETLLKLGARAAEGQGEVLGALRRAGEWLGGHRDVEVVNHTAGAIAALQNIFLLTGERCFAQYRRAKVEELLAHQHPEGWFYEYGGADPGYLSLAVDYLAKDLRHSGDERLAEAVQRALAFMVWFLHPDGSYGGEYGSRNVKYLMPHGLELLAPRSPEARLLLGGLYRALRQGRVVSPAVMDDRYTGFFLNKYAEAWADHRPWFGEGAADPPRGVRIFPGAGLVADHGPQACTVVGMSKHGVVKCYATGGEGGLLYGDTGYFAVFADGAVATTQWLDLGVEQQVRAGAGRVEIEVHGAMARMNTSLPLRRYLIPFRLFLGCFGWSGALMEWFGAKVKERMILKKHFLPLQVERHIQIEEHELRIADRLRLGQGRRLVRLARIPQAAALHVASSRYWQPGEGKAEGHWQAGQEELALLNRGGVLRVLTRVRFAQGQVCCTTGEDCA